MGSFRVILDVLFGLLIVAISVVSVVSYCYPKQVRDTVSRLNHTGRSVQQATDLAAAYRSFLLQAHRALNREDASRAYKYSIEAFNHRLRALYQCVRDNPAQQNNLDSLAAAFAVLRLHTDSLLESVSRSPKETSHALEITSPIVYSVESRLDTVRKIEEQRMTERERESRTRHDDFQQTFLLLLVGIGVLLGSTFLAVRYNCNKRIHAQAQLIRSRDLFGKIFYESPIALVISDLDTDEIFDCNMVFAHLVNYRRQEIIGSTSAALGIFPDQSNRKEIADRAKQQDHALNIEAYLIPRGNQPVNVLIHTHRIEAYDRTCLLTAFLDMSDHQRAKDEIRKALDAERQLNRLKSNFVTMASHEFRTPLTTILSSTFLLENYSSGETRQKAATHFARIRSSVNSLTSILDEFLSVSKIEEGLVNVSFGNVDLPVLFTGYCANLNTFAKPGQVIHYTHTGKAFVQSDPVLLEKIITNLLTNSIKYSRENSSIAVSTTVDDRFVLTVTDRGIGIPPADQEHLFERFYRASNAGNVQGTGLGLHILKHYVVMLHGTIKLTSEPGAGTTVEISFPVAAPGRGVEV
jgi:signal transduction histidine kinase